MTGVSLGVAQTVLPIGFRWIAKQPATILVASLAWCFAVVIAGINLDTVVESVTGLDTQFNVSAGMGALIAGATIASLPFSTEIVRQVSVVRDFFVTLFFVGLGMTIPAPDGVGVIAVAVLLAVLAIAARLVVMLPLLYATGLDRRIATLTSTKLAQISEFSLVIAFLGLQLGHIDATLNSAIILAFVITAVLTPMLFAKADPIHDWLAPWLSRVGIKAPDQATREDVEEYDLALLGVHRTASSLLHELGETDAELLESHPGRGLQRRDPPADRRARPARHLRRPDEPGHPAPRGSRQGSGGAVHHPRRGAGLGVDARRRARRARGEP